MTMTQTEAMLLTFAIEAVAAAALARSLKLQPTACVLSAIAASAITHPILWAVFFDMRTVLGALTTPVLEGCIILAEAPAYRLIATRRWDDALLLSIIANAASWGAGEIIYALS